LRVVGEEDKDLVLVRELLGAGQVAVAGVAVVAGVDADLAAVDAAPCIDAVPPGLESVQRGAEGLGAELTLDRRDVADLDRRRGDPDVAGGVRAVGAAGRRPATRAARLAGRSRGCAAAGQAAGRPRRPLVAARARLVPAALVAGRHPGVLARALRGLDEGAVGQARATRLED